MSGCQGSVKGKERQTGRAQRIFQGNETIMHNTAMVETLHYTFVKTHKMYNTKSKPLM